MIGASGFVGSAILKEALDRGHHVTAIVRHPEKDMAVAIIDEIETPQHVRRRFTVAY